MVVHAPEGSGLEMITKVPQIQTTNFLDLEYNNLIEDGKLNLESVFDNFLPFPNY
jgi:hypothetical protein